MKPIEHSTLSKPIYDTLKEMILDNQLKPGQKIIQERIAAQLGVSRTPLMKALQMLENEMLVESVPRRGMFVRTVSSKELIDLYYCRESIECMAVRLATERCSTKQIEYLSKLFAPFLSQKGKMDKTKYQQADEEFHNSIMSFCDNAILAKMSKLSQVLSMVYSLGLLREPEETLPEHLDIIEAMQQRDTALAEQKMKEHIQASRDILKYAQQV